MIYQSIKLDNLVDKVPKINTILLCLILFLVRLPPICLIPFSNCSLTSTYALVSYLIFLAVFLLLLHIYAKDIKLSIPKKYILLILFYFLTQSMSVLSSINIYAYLQDYKNIILSLLIFVLTIHAINNTNSKKIASFLLAAGLVNVFYEIIVYFFPDILFTYFEPIFYDKYWQFFEFQYQRNRFFLDSTDEILIPLLFYYLYINKDKITNFFSSLFIILIFMFALFSNTRMKVILFLYSFTLSYKLFFLKIKKINVLLSALLIIFLILIYLSSINLIDFRIVDRFLLTDQNDIETITGRFKYLNEAIWLGISFPLSGVGLGNYSEYISDIGQQQFLNPSINFNNISELNYYPHNIFFIILANSGFLGLISFILLILFFIRDDLSSLRYSPLLHKCFLIMFWGLFLLANTTPTTNFSFQLMFWFLRGVILKTGVISTNTH